MIGQLKPAGVRYFILPEETIDLEDFGDDELIEIAVVSITEGIDALGPGKAAGTCLQSVSGDDLSALILKSKAEAFRMEAVGREGHGQMRRFAGGIHQKTFPQLITVHLERPRGLSDQSARGRFDGQTETEISNRTVQ